MSRFLRRETIRRIVADGAAQNQVVVQAELARAGIEATQATISRDLRAIGAVKGPDGYRVAQNDAGLAPAESSALLAQHVTSIVQAAGLAVLKTTPGSAQLVALELDRFPPADVVGTVAGDDTVLVAVTNASSVRSVCRSLRTLVGLDATDGGEV